jgi:hypothetical protein
MGKELARSIVELLNHFKLTISCNVVRSGVIDFFTDHNFSFSLCFNEETEEIEVKLFVHDKEERIEAEVIAIQ